MDYILESECNHKRHTLTWLRAGRHLHSHASISYGASEHSLNVYEVLCVSDMEYVKWMTFRHGENAVAEGWQPVEGGREANGKALLVAKGEYEK